MYSGLVIVKTKVVASSRFCTNPEMSVCLVDLWKGRKMRRRDSRDGRGRQKRVMAGHQRVKAELRRLYREE